MALATVPGCDVKPTALTDARPMQAATEECLAPGIPVHRRILVFADRCGESVIDPLKRVDTMVGKVIERISALAKPFLERVTRSRAIAFASVQVQKPVVAFLVALTLLITRRPNVILKPSFYIEDGPQYFGNAFNIGGKSLSLVYAGYYHVVPRLVALVSAALPLHYAPLIMSLVAVVIQAGVAAFMMSSRLSKQVPSVWLRGAMALLIIAYPNSDEMHGNMSHAQWFLLILAVALLFSEPGKRQVSRIADYALIALTALTGPFSVALAPLAWASSRKSRYHLIMAVILSAGAVASFAAMMSQPRFGIPGKTDLSKLLHVFSTQVVVGGTMGLSGTKEYTYSYLLDLGELALTIGGLTLLAWGFVRGPRLFKGLIFVGMVSVLAALKSGATWLGLATAGQGERYFFILGLMLLVCVVFATQVTRSNIVRLAGQAFCLLAAWSIVGNWRHVGARDDYDNRDQLASFASLPAGSTVAIRTAGDRTSSGGWVMTLRK